MQECAIENATLWFFGATSIYGLRHLLQRLIFATSLQGTEPCGLTVKTRVELLLASLVIKAKQFRIIWHLVEVQR